jgi:hypothetical protein
VTALIHLIQSLLSEEEGDEMGDARVVMFVQYSDLMHSMRDVLVSEGTYYFGRLLFWTIIIFVYMRRH